MSVIKKDQRRMVRTSVPYPSKILAFALVHRICCDLFFLNILLQCVTRCNITIIKLFWHWHDEEKLKRKSLRIVKNEHSVCMLEVISRRVLHVDPQLTLQTIWIKRNNNSVIRTHTQTQRSNTKHKNNKINKINNTF